MGKENNILSFDYSYGYDCKRLYNLIVLDDEILVFFSGNFLHFFNVQTSKLWFRRSAFGSCIGCIGKNPMEHHFVVGENGNDASIVIYNWPAMDVINIIKRAAVKIFTSLTYDPTGKLLIVHSGKPDYLLSIYDWSTSTVLFKSFNNADVYKIVFSSYYNNQFVSFGPKYIKFWRITKTFTGNKLEGEEGKFNQTEWSNILCAYPMPDTTVVSGCEWGNILIWKDSQIKVEIGRKLNENCHSAPITQFLYENNELWSISIDGQIKLWYFKKIDFAKVTDEQGFITAEPIYEIHYPNIMFLGVHKAPKQDFYFVQDGNGGLWYLHLTSQKNPEPAIQLYKCHGGAVTDISTCPWNDYLFSLGIDGKLQMYEYVTRKLLHVHQFLAKGTCLLWLPLNVCIIISNIINL
ncbi:hypothetical protein FQA39_LY10305 [Lamprigera yunnana]|nr:hypothetical protein FQA39_LY10305 [Lamprigera yunnana]